MTRLTHNSINDPFRVAMAKADAAIAAGFTIYQKFTCAGCGQRLTIDEPNTFHAVGTCDRCPALTNIERTGCGFMAVSTVGYSPSTEGDPNAS
jgi:hypothetical protein